MARPSLDDMLTPMTKKLLNFSSPVKYHSLCVWSDLLGFGAPFIKNNWDLPDDSWKKTAERLFKAQREFMGHSLIQSKILVLNDGLGCVLSTDNVPLNLIALFIMLNMRAHMAINRQERQMGLPGTRSIMAYGGCIRYLPPKFHLDDYVLPYTRPNPKKPSNIAKRTGNPTIVFSPRDFQMNTAFSKAFLLDEAGHKYGIEGNNFYIDQSFFEYIDGIICDKKQILWSETNNDIDYKVYASPEDHRYVQFGFRMSKGIAVDYKGWKTTVYRIDSFFPMDEPLPFEMPLKEGYVSAFF